MKLYDTFKKGAMTVLALSLLASGIPFSHTAHVDAADVSTSTFDENNVVLRFGVLSDIHMSGNATSDGLLPDLTQAKQKKLDKAYKILKYFAKEDNNSTLDMVLINGDITDAMNSDGNIWGSVPKLQQNYFEIASFRDITLNNFKDSTTKILYSHGNHDTANGVSLNENKKQDESGFYSGSLFRKILSGYTWTKTVPDNDSPSAQEIADCNKEQLTAYTANSEKDNYNFFYGDDKTEVDDATYGNRHFEIGGYHFLTVEPKDYTATYTDETVQWLDKTLADIVAKDSSKPIFVATHARVKNTIFASAASASTVLNDTLNKYPQVILWGGHEHTALNRELGIWQDGFTAVDAGVVSYLSSTHLDYAPYGAYPSNGTFSGWGNYEYHNASQGEYVEVDQNGNVRIHRIDFYHSDLTEGSEKIAEVGKPWIIDAPKSDKSHLTRYNTTNHANGNEAPQFGTGAEVTATVSGDTINVSFPAASDDQRVISYYVELKKGSSTVEKKELTSFYYDHADASELNGKNYSTTFSECGIGAYTVNVTAIDDYGATASITAEVAITVTPHTEFDLTKLNYEWTGAVGVLTHGVVFNGRIGVSKLTKSQDDLSNDSQIVLNYGKAASIADISQTPYLLIDYYYAHDDSSAKAAASTMRWRPFVEENTGNWQERAYTATLETNRWATAVIQLDPEFFATDNYQHTKYKFEPFGTTAAANLDDNDTMYISGIRFSATKPVTGANAALNLVALDGQNSNAEKSCYTFTHDTSFDGKDGVSAITSINGTDYIVMNCWDSDEVKHINLYQTPKLVVEYYYKHNTDSQKAAASKMKWALFSGSLPNKKQQVAESSLETNKWATATFTFDPEIYQAFDYTFNQYKFYPFSATKVSDLDSGDEMYIAAMYFVPEIESTFTESGVAYVCADRYIKNVYARVYTTIADAAASLGSYDGTIYVKGDIIIDDTKKLDNGTKRGKITIQGFGDSLTEQQKNRIWFKTTGSVRGNLSADTAFDRITLKAPTDEAGIYSKGVMLTMGKDLAFEKTVKNTDEINAAGTKSINFNLGGNYQSGGTSNVTINGGSYDAVSTLYQWDPNPATIGVASHVIFNGGSVGNVFSGVRNSSTGVLTVAGNVTYDFNGGSFGNLYVGHYKNGSIIGNVLYNVKGGTFTNGITFGNGIASGNASIANATVLVDGKSDKLTSAVTVKNGANTITKTSDNRVWSAIVNNAEGGKGKLDAGLTADYKLYVYGGSAEPVFNDDKTLKGFSITNDNGYAPVIDGMILTKTSDGLYDLSAYKNVETEIYFNELGIDPTYVTGDTAPQDKKLTVVGAQIRVTGNDDNYATDLRFVAQMGRTIFDKVKATQPTATTDTDIGFGFIVLPKDMLGEKALTKTTDKAAIVPAVKLYSNVESNDYIQYTVCLTGIELEKAKLEREYTVRPYVTYTDSLGKVRTVYGDAYATSLANIAKQIAKNESDPYYNIVKNNILDHLGDSTESN